MILSCFTAVLMGVFFPQTRMPGLLIHLKQKYKLWKKNESYRTLQREAIVEEHLK
jgi:hypothetical protein